MLQAHSFLWNYLWVAPNLLLLVLAFLIWRREPRFPVFVAFAVLSALEQLVLYAADVLPAVTPESFWRIDWTCLLLDALLKFVLIAEIFARLFGPYPSIARTSRLVIRGVGLALVLAAAVIAAHSRSDISSPLISGTHLLGQTAFLIECGLVLFLFVFAAYFRLSWDRTSFGVALGLGVSASVHLASWALLANSVLALRYRARLDFLNMGTYHVCVLLWFYYLLVPERSVSKAVIPPPEHSLEVWNQELERLLHL